MNLKKILHFFYYGGCAPYVIASTFNTGSILYSLKDLYAFFVIFLLMPKILIKDKPYHRSRLVVSYFSIVIILSFIHYIFDDSFNTVGYFVGLREMVISPFLFMTIGYFTQKCNSNTEKLLYYSLLFVCVSTVIYELVLGTGFTADRVKSFWNGEHESGNIGALLFLITVLRYGLPSFSFRRFSLKRVPIHVVCAYSFSIILLIGSGSRSVFIGIFTVFLFDSVVANIDIIRLRFKAFIVPALSFTLLGITLTIYYWDSIFSRPLDHGFYLRLNQWLPALEIISKNWLQGIGIHQMGAIEGVYSSYYVFFDSARTSTMDSSIIKYMFTMGVPLTIILVSLLIIYSFKTFKLQSYLKLKYCGMFIIYVLAIGVFTGKLGAFPTNFYLWSSLGRIIFIERNVRES